MRVGVFFPLSEQVGDKIRELSSRGFSSGQLHGKVGLYTDALAEQIRAACEECGFTVTAMFADWSGYRNFSYPEMYRTLGLVPVYLREQRTKDILEGAAFAKKIGVNNVFTHIGYIRDDPEDPDRQEIKCILRYIARTLAAQGQCLQIETGEMLPNSLKLLIHEIGCDNVGVNFDPANFLINGRANPADALTMLLPFVRGVHAKDAVYPKDYDPKGKETPIGKGMVMFQDMIIRLRKYGYDGDLTIEREISGEQQMLDILEAAEYLRGLIRREEELEEEKRNQIKCICGRTFGGPFCPECGRSRKDIENSMQAVQDCPAPPDVPWWIRENYTGTYTTVIHSDYGMNIVTNQIQPVSTDPPEPQAKAIRCTCGNEFSGKFCTECGKSRKELIAEADKETARNCAAPTIAPSPFQQVSPEAVSTGNALQKVSRNVCLTIAESGDVSLKITTTVPNSGLAQDGFLLSERVEEYFGKLTVVPPDSRVGGKVYLRRTDGRGVGSGTASQPGFAASIRRLSPTSMFVSADGMPHPISFNGFSYKLEKVRNP